MSTGKRAVSGLGVSAALVGLLMLGGCTVGYTVDVRNDTAQPIGVALMRADASGQPNSLSNARIAPKSRGGVTRYNVPDKWMVYVEVDATANPGRPVQMDVKPGLTVVRVTQDGDLPTGTIRMEMLEQNGSVQRAP